MSDHPGPSSPNSLGDNEYEVFSRFSERFRLLAKLITGNDQDAEDIAQETIKILLAKYRTTDGGRISDELAAGVFRKVVGNYIQRKRTERKYRAAQPDGQGDVPYAVVNRDPLSLIDLKRCMKMVFRKNRNYGLALALAIKGYRIPEIAKRLGRSVNATSTLLSRGRSKLLQCLETGRV